MFQHEPIEIYMVLILAIKHPNQRASPVKGQHIKKYIWVNDSCTLVSKSDRSYAMCTNYRKSIMLQNRTPFQWWLHRQWWQCDIRYQVQIAEMRCKCHIQKERKKCPLSLLQKTLPVKRHAAFDEILSCYLPKPHQNKRHLVLTVMKIILTMCFSTGMNFWIISGNFLTAWVMKTLLSVNFVMMCNIFWSWFNISYSGALNHILWSAMQQCCARQTCTYDIWFTRAYSYDRDLLVDDNCSYRNSCT